MQISRLIADTQISSHLEKRHLDPKIWSPLLRRYIEGPPLTDDEYDAMKAKIERRKLANKNTVLPVPVLKMV